MAEALGAKQNYVSRWLAGAEPRGPMRDRILEMARELGVIELENEGRIVVPIMGWIGAGGDISPEYEQVPVDGLEQVELPLSLGDNVIGFQVRGDSMLPKYADGAVILVHREQIRGITSLIGDEVAVRTYDNKRYLKVLMPGKKEHTYNLESFNARTILDVRIAWASEIVAMIPPRQVRRMEKGSRPKKSKSTGGRESAPRQRN